MAAKEPLERGVYWIQGRKKGDRAFAWHLSPRGETRLKIHASQYRSHEATKVLADVRPNNPDWDFRAVLIPAVSRIVEDVEV